MPRKRMSKEEAIAATRKGDLVRTLYKLAASYIAPIFWETQEPGQPTQVSNGTTFFVKTDQRQFGVTAAHVLDGFAASKERHGRPCHVGFKGLYFNLEDRVIDRGRQIVVVDPDQDEPQVKYRVDLATYSLTDDEFARLDRQVREEPIWPPPRVQEGGSFFYAGFPAESREKVDERSWIWGSYHANGIVTVAGQDDFVCRLERTEIVESPNLLPIPRMGYAVGGLSGAPIFALSDGDIDSWTLAGVIYDGGPGFQQDGSPGEIEQVRAIHADYIRADGTLYG